VTSTYGNIGAGAVDTSNGGADGCGFDTAGDKLLPFGDTIRGSPMSAMVRTQSLRGYRELVRDLGGNPTRLLRKAEIDPAWLNSLSAFITFESLVDLLEQTANDLDCADFGLRLAERQDIGVLGTLAVAMRYSATVGEAMRCTSKYLHVYNAAIAFTILPGTRPTEVRLVFGLLVDRPKIWAQTAEHGIGLAWRIWVLLSEGRCHLHHVWFPHAPLAPEAKYRSRFDASLTFGADRPAMALAARDLDLPISEHNQELHELATRYLDREVQRGRTEVAAQVRQAIEALLGTGTCDYRTVANALHMHPRTLQRRLQDENTTLEVIKDDTRRHLAQQYLSQPDLALNQVAALLDYSNPSALSRSCQRWFNTNPRDLRLSLTTR
jgi:AraC-like DNA-binding protein